MSTLVAYLSMIFLFTGNTVANRNSINARRNGVFELSVIHLNDFHTRFIQTGSNPGNCIESSENECFGGFSRVYTASHQLVNERPNAIFLNAGDNFQGTLWYNVHQWNVTATFLNMLPLDALTIGNHEFEYGIAGLVPFLKTIKAPAVVTNIDASVEPDIQGLYSNSTIIDRNGTKIGVIGVILSKTNTIASTGNLKFLDEVTTVNAEAERLKNAGIDIIVVLSHCGLDTDRAMAAACPNVDLIVGGHSHTFLYSGTPPDTDVPVDEYPVVVTQKETHRTVLIVQAAAFTKYLGNISIWFDSAGEIVDWDGNPILLDNSVEQNPEVLALLQPWRVAVDELDNTIIGHTHVDLIDNCQFGECKIGNLITDAMVDAYIDSAENETYWTYAAVACIDISGINTRPIAAHSNLTYGDAYNHQRYATTWDVVELRGSDLMEILENSVSKSTSPDSFANKNFLQWSGIKATIKLDNEAFSRVTSLKIRCRACKKIIYEDVVPDECYRVVVPSYLLIEDEGNQLITNRHRDRISGTRNIDNYVNYIKKIGPINIGIEGRIILEGTWHG